MQPDSAAESKQPVPMSLYPAEDSVGQAIAQLEAYLPITTRNELVAAMALYHNTVLKTLTPPLV